MGTMGKQIWGTILILLVCASLLLSQSLVEVAKKEKERRAKLKGKSGKVVTNDDLNQVKKLSNLVTNEDLKKGDRQPSVVTNEDLKKGDRQPSVSVPQSQAPQVDKTTKDDTPAIKPAPTLSDPPERAKADEKELLESLESKYETAKAQVEMLLTKMNGLFMKYYSTADTTPKEMIQSEISQTALQLQKARDDEEKAKKDLKDYESKKRK